MSTKVKTIIGLLVFGSFMAIAGTSTRTITADIIRTVGGVRAFWTLPNGANDTFVGNTTAATLTAKSMDFSANTFTNFDLTSGAFINQLPVPAGGTGLNSGTSGGIPFFNASNTMQSSGILTAGGLVIGGGAGTTPAIMSGTTGGIPYFSSTNVASTSNLLPLNAFVLGGGSGAAPSTLAGTSGGVPYFSSTNVPSSSGVLSANGIVLGGGAGSAPTVLAGTSGGVPYFNGTNTASTSGALTSNAIVMGGGAGAAPNSLANGSAGQLLLAGAPPTWGNNTMTKQIFTSTGSTTGYWFTITSGAATAGTTYTNNTQTFTVLNTIAAQTLLFTSGTGAPLASGTLTKTGGGAGDATITFSANVVMATYTTPANARLLKVIIVGGGAGGGSVTSVAVSAGGGAGGGGGGTVIKYITSPVATYFYSVGTGGAAGTAGTNGSNGVLSAFMSVTGGGSNMIAGGGGSGLGCSVASTLCVNSAGGVSTPVSSGGDLNFRGGQGGLAVVLNGTTQACGASGGNSMFSNANSNLGNCGGNVAGATGVLYGGGGGGGVNINGGAAQNGGVGAAGLVYVEEYY